MAGFEHSVTMLIARYGLIALYFLLTLEEMGLWLPLPGDLLIVYFGYQAAGLSRPYLAAIPVVLTVVAAALSGSTPLFLIVGHYRGLLRRIGPFIHLNEANIQRMESWLRKRGTIMIVIMRFVPGFRIATTVVSATLGVRLTTFARAVAISAFLWGLFYFSIGAAGASAIVRAERLLRTEISIWLLPPLAAAALIATLLHFWHRWSAKPREPA